MIDPKQKAVEIVETYAEEIPKLEFGVLLESDWETAINCAKIDVQNTIDVLYKLSDSGYLVVSERDYYEEVLNELSSIG